MSNNELQQPLPVDEKDTDGHTALMWAAYQGDAISVDMLLRHGASVVARDNAGLTPLHWAVVKGNKTCIKRLIEHGSDLEARDELDKTPRDMAEELKGQAPYQKGLEDAGYTEDGVRRGGKLSDVSEHAKRWLTISEILLLQFGPSRQYSSFSCSTHSRYFQYTLVHLWHLSNSSSCTG